MATTYQLISSNVLTSNAASVTFSAIPSTYTDLVLQVSGRSDNSSTSPTDSIRLYFNNNTGTVYSFTRLLGDATSATTFTAPANGDELYFNNALPTSFVSTANTFSNAEIYIPNYRSSANKPVSGFVVAERSHPNAHMGIVAGLARITSAITTIEVTLNPTRSFVTGSSFYLYGIKNS